MPRWEPHAADRLAQAALDLFAERGYESTTVIDIAQRAGLGKTTFFRHFQDKREVLFGGGTMNDLLTEAILAAPASATPLDAVGHAMDAVGREVFTAARRDDIVRRQAVIDANRELREREALKTLGLAETMAAALTRRGSIELVSRVVAELGVLASTVALERWSVADDGPEFGELARQALREVQDISGSC